VSFARKPIGRRAGCCIRCRNFSSSPPQTLQIPKSCHCHCHNYCTVSTVNRKMRALKKGQPKKISFQQDTTNFERVSGGSGVFRGFRGVTSVSRTDFNLKCNEFCSFAVVAVKVVAKAYLFVVCKSACHIQKHPVRL